MEGAGHWGDQLVLTALSHLLLRPIHVVNDRELDSQAVTVIQPPDFIDTAVWGEPVWLAYHQGVHYEGTEAMEVPLVAHVISDGEQSDGASTPSFAGQEVVGGAGGGERSGFLEPWPQGPVGLSVAQGLPLGEETPVPE